MSVYDAQMIPGTLYIVPTPIGNLGDLTLRARAVLEGADVLACEDTRTTSRLLSALSIKSRAFQVSCHDHNERGRASEIVAHLQAGRIVALVSDAGTPLTSDPGFAVVTAVLEAALPIVPLPGPTAFLTALVASGLPTDSHLFIGFLPRKDAAMVKALKPHATTPHTLCLYTSPHRLIKTLEALQATLGDRSACVARELTKRFEEFTRGTLSEIHADYSARTSIKGEIVVLVEGYTPPEHTLTGEDIDEARALVKIMKANRIKPALIKKVVAAHHKLDKASVYKLITEG